MKFRVTFKTPDALGDAIQDAVAESLPESLSEEEKLDVSQGRRSAVLAQCRKWFEYSEYVTIEVDTEADTATVVRR